MPILVSSSVQDTAASDLVDNLNGNLGSIGVLEFFDGILPASCADPDDGNMLCSCALSNPALNAASGNNFTLNTVSTGTVVADGTVTYWRMKSGGGTVHCQGSAGTGVLDNIVFNNDSWTIGNSVDVDTFDVTLVVGGP